MTELPSRAASWVPEIDPASPVLEEGEPLVSAGVTLGNPTVAISPIGGVEWAVYAASGYDAANPPYTLRLDLSGSNGKLWIGIADFTRGTWCWQEIGPPYNFGSFITVPEPSASFRPADGALFIVLLAYGGSKLSFRGGDTGGYQVEILHTPEPTESAQNPQYAPTGTELIFTLFHSGYDQGPAGLYKLDLTTLADTPFLDEAGVDNVNTTGSAWNAATTRITFSSDRGGADDIWVIPELGGDLEQVTDHVAPPAYSEPTFSPDGYAIVFEKRQLGNSNIAKVQLPGGEPTALTSGAILDCRQPVWSPLGSQILYQRSPAGMNEWNLVLMSSNGGESTQLTFSGNDTDGSWSSDGKWIVFASATGGLEHPNIFIVSALGGKPTRVTFDEGLAHSAPCFSPDGQAIVFELHTTEDDASPTVLARTVLP